MKTMTVKVERIIPASPAEVYKSWLNPKVPGSPWYEGNKVILNPKVDGLFYWNISKTPHYGIFTQLKKGSTIQHTWISPYTNGLESVVTVTLKKKGRETLMTLVHAGLPKNVDGRGHQDGWSYFLDLLEKKFLKGSRKRK